MAQNRAYDAVVVGSGPNGLSASTTLAREGLSVLLMEARETVGGGTRSGAVTEPGFLHDICSAIHPMGTASPHYVGGDIVGGAQDFWQLFLQPALRRTVYSTPVSRLYICSSSIPPGAGVHGMCGYHAARAALRHLRRRPSAAA